MRCKIVTEMNKGVCGCNKIFSGTLLGLFVSCQGYLSAVNIRCKTGAGMNKDV